MPTILSTTDQRTFLHLLADYDSPGGAPDLLRVVDECGGVRHVIYRFFRHYDVSRALTQHASRFFCFPGYQSLPACAGKL